MSGATRESVSVEEWVYASVLVCSSLVFGYLFRQELDSAICYATVTVLCIGLTLFRWTVFEALIPPVALGGLGILGFIAGNSVPQSSGGHVFALAVIATVAAAARLQSLAKRASHRITSSRMNYTPTRTSKSSAARGLQTRFGVGHFLTIGFVLFAWWFAGYLSSQLTAFVRSPNNYRQAYRLLDQRVGLLPEWYVGIKILFMLTLLLWLIDRVFGYLSLRQDGSVAAMHLRSELWKWDGSEQRMVAKQLQKNEVG